MPGLSPIQLHEGAVIFGQNADFGWLWVDSGNPETGEPLTLPLPLPRSGESQIDFEFHDSGIGSSLSLTSGDYNIGIVCALQKELLAVRALFDSRHEDVIIPPQDTNHYALGCMGTHNVVAACLPSGEYGTCAAADVLSHMVRSFSELQCYFLVGIGGGVPSKQNDIRLGDIIVSHPGPTHGGVIQYDLGKILEENVFERTGSLQRPPRFILTAISSLMSDPDLVSQTRLQNYIEKIGERHPLYKYPGLKQDKLFRADSVHPSDKKSCRKCKDPVERLQRSIGNQPHIRYGLIASGNSVLKNAQVRDRLGTDYNVLCVEMEAAGVANGAPCLIVRGICDYVDSHKNKKWQEYASATAAAYVKLLLSVIRSPNESGKSTSTSARSPTSLKTPNPGKRRLSVTSPPSKQNSQMLNSWGI
ncbi:hypothetical protein ABW20_dc0105285 [Dactylellina cionopaga]|nr:hypothetical protein ABW20_dc0105285 [Dactylellina cionopaga]